MCGNPGYALMFSLLIAYEIEEIKAENWDVLVSQEGGTNRGSYSRAWAPFACAFAWL